MILEFFPNHYDSVIPRLVNLPVILVDCLSGSSLTEEEISQVTMEMRAMEKNSEQMDASQVSSCWLSQNKGNIKMHRIGTKQWKLLI